MAQDVGFKLIWVYDYRILAELNFRHSSHCELRLYAGHGQLLCDDRLEERLVGVYNAIAHVSVLLVDVPKLGILGFEHLHQVLPDLPRPLFVCFSHVLLQLDKLFLVVFEGFCELLTRVLAHAASYAPASH